MPENLKNKPIRRMFVRMRLVGAMAMQVHIDVFVFVNKVDFFGKNFSNYEIKMKLMCSRLRDVLLPS